MPSLVSPDGTVGGLPHFLSPLPVVHVLKLTTIQCDQGYKNQIIFKAGLKGINGNIWELIRIIKKG